VSDDAVATATHDEDGEHAREHPHLPPPSAVPINLALALAITLTGFLTDIRAVVGPAMWGIGLIYLLVTCFFWARGARSEYLELPEDGGH
jgi:hypothetical protein